VPFDGGPAGYAVRHNSERLAGDFGLDLIVPGHCTGFRAVHALLNEFGDGIVAPSAVGRFHVF